MNLHVTIDRFEGEKKQIEKAHMSKEQAEQTRQMGEKWGSISTRVAAYAGPVLVAFASPPTSAASLPFVSSAGRSPDNDLA